MAAPTRLQQDIAERILQLVRDDALAAGAWLNENATARRLGVSRTPVRAALDHLAEQGVVRRHLNKGIELIQLPAASDSARPPETVDLAMVRLARERENGLLPDEVSELEVMRRYELGRPEAQKLLARLADLDMVERKPGYGWRFLVARRLLAWPGVTGAETKELPCPILSPTPWSNFPKPAPPRTWCGSRRPGPAR